MSAVQTSNKREDIGGDITSIGDNTTIGGYTTTGGDTSTQQHRGVEMIVLFIVLSQKQTSYTFGGYVLIGREM